MRRSVAVLGDAADPNAWSGIPYHFWRAAARAGFVTDAIRVRLDSLAWPRRAWAAGQVARGRRPAGFQYSPACLDRAESQIPAELLAGEVISFSQHFPRTATVRRHGGRITYYIDATFAALSSGRGLDLRLPADVVREGCKLECDNYKLADRVVTMARWTAESVINDCGIAPEKVFTVLPGANLELPDDWRPPQRPAGRPGRDRALVLGFVGKEWQRKGLPLLCSVRDRLAAQGWAAVIRAAGAAPAEVARRSGVEWQGFIDKRSGPARFADFLAGCDVGCLFSEREALGISTLEFLRAGVPVAGFAVEGLADTLPPEAGMRFLPGTSLEQITERFSSAMEHPQMLTGFAARARALSEAVTWLRCIKELQQIWMGSAPDSQVRLWEAAPLHETCAADAR